QLWKHIGMNYPTASEWGIAPAKLYSEVSFPTQASGYSFLILFNKL
ncbi:MAG: hypothetical protein ACI9XB_004323, partial [Gammaproteobacteria bacterium]